MNGDVNSRHAVCVGSFDPATLGHLDIVRRGARLFDRVTVGIGINPDKEPLFSTTERLELTRQVLAPCENVVVTSFDGLAVNFARQQGAAVLLRGVRSLMDIESEMAMSLTNRTLAPDIETVFLMAGENYSHISSTLIKQIARLGREDAASRLTNFVPEEVISPLLAKYRES